MRKQAFFNNVLEQYKKKNEQAKANNQPAPGIPILTEASLRLEQFINTTNSTYTFPVLQGEVGQGSSQVLPNEIRLQTNDNFHIDTIGFYLAVTAASTDTAYRLQTNANEIFLVTAAAALNYMNIYNGILKINVNQVDVLTNYPVYKHFFVGQTQRLSSVVNNNFDQVDMENNGSVQLAPSIMLSGAYTNTITIQLPAAVSSALASNNSRMVLDFWGLRAQNAAIRK